MVAERDYAGKGLTFVSNNYSLTGLKMPMLIALDSIKAAASWLNIFSAYILDEKFRI